jgi:hypothetical protein
VQGATVYIKPHLDRRFLSLFVSEEQREDLTSTSLGFFVADTDPNNNNTAAHTNFFISIARLHLTVTIRHLNNPVPTQNATRH